MKLAFCDVETTGLNSSEHEVWEFAAIIRDPDKGRAGDVEYVFQIEVNESTADPVALDIGRFHERRDLNPLNRFDAASNIDTILGGCVIVGANPQFDTGFLTVLLEEQGFTPSWHYRPVCVEAVAYGFLQGFAAARFGAVITDFPLPWKSADLIAPLVDRERYPQHTALGDAQWVRDTWDAIHAGGITEVNALGPVDGVG